jgi:AAA domain
MQDTQPSQPDNAAASHEAGAAASAPGPFVVTKEHRRFAEFADAVRRDRYIGLCYGPPGVGKTLSARQYAGWDIVGPCLQAFRPLDVVPVPQQAMASRTIVYTPKVHTTPRTLDKEITFLHDRLSWGIEWDLQTPKTPHGLSGWRRKFVGVSCGLR